MAKSKIVKKKTEMPEEVVVTGDYILVNDVKAYRIIVVGDIVGIMDVDTGNVIRHTTNLDVKNLVLGNIYNEFYKNPKLTDKIELLKNDTVELTISY